MTAVPVTRYELLGLVKDWSRRTFDTRVMWFFDSCLSSSGNRELAFMSRPAWQRRDTSVDAFLDFRCVSPCPVCGRRTGAVCFPASLWRPLRRSSPGWRRGHREHRDPIAE